jgi:hypothetical protein
MFTQQYQYSLQASYYFRGQLNAVPCLERNISLRNSNAQVAVQMIRSIRESKIPPTRPAGMTYAEVGGLVDLLQVSNIFLTQLNNLEVA